MGEAYTLRILYIANNKKNACAPFEHIQSIGDMTQRIALELCGVCGRVGNWDLKHSQECIKSTLMRLAETP